MAENEIKVRLLHAVHTTAEWTNRNPVLRIGEIVVDSTEHRTKTGDGISNWIDLPYDDQSVYDQLSSHVSAVANSSTLGHVKVDTSLSSSSTNPVQNNIIYEALSGKAPVSHTHTKSQIVDLDTGTPTDSGLTKLYTSTGSNIDGTMTQAAIKTALDGKASTSHGNHVPSVETANNARFLRNDNTWQTVTPSNIGAAEISHGYHVPTPGTANNAIFLRNDNTWQTITPENIGAATSTHEHNASDLTSGVISTEILPIVPVSKGGTGVSTLSSGQVLIGNGTGAVATRAIDTSVTSGSLNLITSGAVYTGLSGKLSLSGGTMTGNIQYTLYSSTQIPLKVYGGDSNGQGISLGAGGATIVGSGESSKSCESLLSATNENLWLTSDQSIHFYTNCQTIDNKVGMVFDTSRNLYPDTNNTGSVGTSSYKWTSMYATTFYGALSGNASTSTKATQDSAGQQINTTYIKGLSVSGTTVTYTKGDGTTGTITTQDTNTTYGNATTSTAGLMSAADKTKLNNIDAYATNIPFIVGTQTAVTGSWTGTTSEFSSLVDGQTIRYWLPYNGSGNATLNLTLSSGSTTGAIACYWKGTSRLTTHYAAGTVITLTYRTGATISGSSTTYTGWWVDADYNSDTMDRLRYQQAIKCGTTAIVAGNIIVGKDGLYEHLKLGNSFDVTYPILYASSAIAASSTGTSNYMVMPFTISTTQSITFTAYKPVFIKGSLSGTLFTPVSTAPLTQTVPTSADGYEYILLGVAYSTTSLYLLGDHPIFAYKGGAFGQISSKAITDLSVSGKVITYTRGDGNTGTITTQDTTYSAGTGLSLSGTTFNHSNSVTAGTAQGDASKTLTFGGTFTIPTVTYDAQGHVTGKGTTTMTMPANPNVDTKVTQTAVTDSSYTNWRSLVWGSSSSSTEGFSPSTVTDVLYSSTGLSVQPSTGTIRATTFKGNATSASKLATARTIALTGSVTGSGTFDGSGNLNITTTTNHSHSYLPLSGGTVTGTISLTNGSSIVDGTITAHLKGTMGSNDYWRIAVGATESDAGFVEFATADNGNEPIYIRQYSGSFATLTRTLTLLDGSGNSSFPGTVTASAFSGNATSASKVYSTLTNPTTATTYFIPFHASASSANKSLLNNNGLQYYTLEGTTSATGTAQLALGNSTVSGTAGNKRGGINLYGTSSGYTYLIPGNNTTSNITLTLPSSTGTIALTSSNVASATKLATARTIALTGSVTGSGTFDGSGNLSITTTTNHSHSYSSITSKPDLLNCLRMYGGTALASTGTTADSNAQYNTIALSTATAGTSGFSKVLTDLPKGKYSVMIRMKISANTSTGNILKIECGDTSALNTFYVKPSMFTAASTYQTFGFTVEHTTTSFTAALSVGTALSGVTVNIDYLAIAPTFTAISSVA